jgi:transposase
VPETPAADDAAGLRAANARLRELLGERDERIESLAAENAALREQLAALGSQVEALAAQVKSNSRNSSKPPSSDGPAKPAPKSLRGKSVRGPGRPKGQPGATMQLSDHPDKVVRHRPKACSCCGKSLRKGEVTSAERRQVIDIPAVKAQVTEHQLLTVKCACGRETKAPSPDGALAPVQYGPRLMGTGLYLWHGQFLSRDRACQALSELFGCAPAPGALASAARRAAGLLAPSLAAIAARLKAAEVAHFDETGFRVAGRLAWVHSASAGPFALFTVHAKRGKDGMDAAGILPAFAGIAVHDAWAPYDCYDAVAGHALCGAHVLRELVAVTETGTGHDVTWAKQAIDALNALNQAAEEARQAGKAAIDEDFRKKHEDWYRDAAKTGITLNEGRNGALQKKRRALALRMSNREADYLRFARDLRVPFTNNQAEQSIRMAKLRIKVSGCMRSMTGAEEFCAIRSYLHTATRHGLGALDAITRAIQGQPWIPETG